MKKNITKRKWLILIFTILVLSSSLFVWWMSSSIFKESYREIKQQYYSVVAGQVVSELESSIKYGKSLDSFYNINAIFEKLTSLLPSHIKAAITNSDGDILYTSLKSEESGNDYIKALQNPNLAVKIKSITSSQKYSTLEQDNYEIIILPIYDKSNTIIGSFNLIYPISSINEELEPQRMENLKISLLILIIPILVLIIFFSLIPIEDKQENEEKIQKDKEKETSYAKKLRLVLYVIPMFIVLTSIGVQSTIMYNEYKIKYKNALSDSASGILSYIKNSMDNLHEKGISYDRMYGLSEYLTEKAKNTPIIWNIRIYNNIADTEKALNRENTWLISAPLQFGSKFGNTQVEIQISQEYINDKMFDMLLAFLVTMVVAAIIIAEAMRLPDILMFRQSSEYNIRSEMQYEKITSGLRIITFMIFMGIYTSMPYSSILMRQLNAKIFNLSTDVTASLPMTLELLAVMIFSMIFTKLNNKVKIKKLLYFSGICIILGNCLSAFASSPIQIILFRLICGVGFAGLKNQLNTIVSFGSEGNGRTGLNIAAMNAGLLGGITCGGSLGAVIANSLSIYFTFMFTAGVLLLSIVLILYIIPWKLLNLSMNSIASNKKSLSKDKNKIVFNKTILKYILIVTLPLNIGLMLIVALIPGYVQKIELPVILISYGYLVNGLAGIYIGPILAKFLSNKLGKTSSVSLMLLIGGIAILILGVRPSVAIILLSTALMGIFDGFGSPVTMDYFIEIPEIKSNVDVSSYVS